MEIALVGGQQLVHTRNDAGDMVQLMNAMGQVVLSLQVTEAGPVLRFEGTLSIEAEKIRLHGRTALELSAGGDVRVKANDDVRLDGERVMVNC